jgi:hypothetical protein
MYNVNITTSIVDSVHFLSLPPRHKVSRAGHALVFTRDGEMEEHITVNLFEIDNLKPWVLLSLR